MEWHWESMAQKQSLMASRYSNLTLISSKATLMDGLRAKGLSKGPALSRQIVMASPIGVIKGYIGSYRGNKV